MAWIVKLVSIGAEGDEHSTDVMRIAKPDDLTDLASLGPTLGTHPPRLTITHIVRMPIASIESAVILSLPPDHGGVTGAGRHEQQRSRLAGGGTPCGGSSR